MDKPHTVLCVDDEKNILSALKRLLRKEDYELLTASNGEEALKILDENTVQLVMSDQRMPEMSGTELFEKVKERYPEIIRIILTGYTEIDAITGAINQGNIYKFFLKPWNDETLKLEIRKALDQYDLIKINKELTEKVKEQNEALMRVNDTLEQKVEERTRELELRNQALEVSRTILDQLPYPVVGIDNEGFIVLVNQRAEKIIRKNGSILIGEHLCTFFDSEIENKALNAISDQEHVKIDGVQLSGNHYRMDILPMTGRFIYQGAIIVLNTVNH
ncbi:MAG: response regulator [Proteobacteria bacterium]|nr:response regulator [Pseudomonadota bacterium]